MHRLYRILVGYPVVKHLLEPRRDSWEYKVNMNLNEVDSDSGK
jgi:hypothetical protein